VRGEAASDAGFSQEGHVGPGQAAREDKLPGKDAHERRQGHGKSGKVRAVNFALFCCLRYQHVLYTSVEIRSRQSESSENTIAKEALWFPNFARIIDS
jgi:hypothetical protein